MSSYDVNACMDAFCKLCEEAVVSDLISADECQYWVFELGYQSKKGSLEEFGKLCDLANTSELISTIDCQYWLFERGYLASKQALSSASGFELGVNLSSATSKFVKLNLH